MRLPVSNDTLLRVVRRRGSPAPTPPTVVGINDWVWRRNHRYGTIIGDLERRRPISLLPDREPRQGSGLAEPATANRHRRSRSGRRLRFGGRQSGSACGPGRRLLALDGERQPRLPRRGAQVDAPDPQRHWRHDHQPSPTQRQMYGRGKLDVLQARLIGHAT